MRREKHHEQGNEREGGGGKQAKRVSSAGGVGGQQLLLWRCIALARKRQPRNELTSLSECAPETAPVLRKCAGLHFAASRHSSMILRIACSALARSWAKYLRVLRAGGRSACSRRHILE